MKMNRILVGFLLFTAACQPDAPRPTPDAVSSAPVAATRTSNESGASAAPMVEVPPVVASTSAAPVAVPAPSASAKDEPVEAYCVTASQSLEIAKPHHNADPPYTNCAAGIFSHCGGGNGERGHLCSRPLDVNATTLARKTKPGMCCYQ